MRTEAYEVALRETRRFLKTRKTAAEVAAHFQISAFAAYERLQALATRGEVEATGKTPGPKGRTGPKAAMWRAV